MDDDVNENKKKKKKHLCSTCGSGFTKRCDLIRHERIHTGEKPYKCDLCGASFSQSFSLKIHYRKHTGEKPFRCEYCSKSFAHSHRLKAHVSKFHPPTAFSCYKCGISFACSSDLNKHAILHSAIPDRNIKGYGHLNSKSQEQPGVQRNRPPEHQRKALKGNYTHSGTDNSQVAEHASQCSCQDNNATQNASSKSFCGCTDIGCSIKLNKIQVNTSPQNKNFICDVCGLMFVDPSALNDHIQTHKEKNAFNLKCASCNKNLVNTSVSGDQSVSCGDKICLLKNPVFVIQEAALNQGLLVGPPDSNQNAKMKEPRQTVFCCNEFAPTVVPKDTTEKEKHKSLMGDGNSPINGLESPLSTLDDVMDNIPTFQDHFLSETEDRIHLKNPDHSQDDLQAAQTNSKFGELLADWQKTPTLTLGENNDLLSLNNENESQVVAELKTSPSRNLSAPCERRNFYPAKDQGVLYPSNDVEEKDISLSASNFQNNVRSFHTSASILDQLLNQPVNSNVDNLHSQFSSVEIKTPAQNNQLIPLSHLSIGEPSSSVQPPPQQKIKTLSYDSPMAGSNLNLSEKCTNSDNPMNLGISPHSFKIITLPATEALITSSQASHLPLLGQLLMFQDNGNNASSQYSLNDSSESRQETNTAFQKYLNYYSSSMNIATNSQSLVTPLMPRWSIGAEDTLESRLNSSTQFLTANLVEPGNIDDVLFPVVNSPSSCLSPSSVISNFVQRSDGQFQAKGQSSTPGQNLIQHITQSNNGKIIPYGSADRSSENCDISAMHENLDLLKNQNATLKESANGNSKGLSSLSFDGKHHDDLSLIFDSKIREEQDDVSESKKDQSREMNVLSSINEQESHPSIKESTSNIVDVNEDAHGDEKSWRLKKCTNCPLGLLDDSVISVLCEDECFGDMLERNLSQDDKDIEKGDISKEIARQESSISRGFELSKMTISKTNKNGQEKAVSENEDQNSFEEKQDEKTSIGKMHDSAQEMDSNVDIDSGNCDSGIEQPLKLKMDHEHDKSLRRDHQNKIDQKDLIHLESQKKETFLSDNRKDFFPDNVVTISNKMLAVSNQILETSSVKKSSMKQFLSLSVSESTLSHSMLPASESGDGDSTSFRGIMPRERIKTVGFNDDDDDISGTATSIKGNTTVLVSEQMNAFHNDEDRRNIFSKSEESGTKISKSYNKEARIKLYKSQNEEARIKISKSSSAKKLYIRKNHKRKITTIRESDDGILSERNVDQLVNAHRNVQTNIDLKLCSGDQLNEDCGPSLQCHCLEGGQFRGYSQTCPICHLAYLFHKTLDEIVRKPVGEGNKRTIKFLEMTATESSPTEYLHLCARLSYLRFFTNSESLAPPLQQQREDAQIPSKITYLCQICGELLSNLSTLNHHLKGHDKSTSFTCKICSAIFHKRYDFVKHCRIHNKERPYKCKVCSRSFTQKSNLHVHMRIHTGERPFSCNICSSSFAHSQALKIHKRFHAKDVRYTCQECGKGFVVKPALEKHKQSHTGERPFACKTCGTKMSSQSSLSRHQKRHLSNELLPFSCSLCSLRFARQSYLNLHMKSHGTSIKKK